MNNTKFISYLNSCLLLNKLFTLKLIDEKDYAKMENFYAAKNCINKDDLYRLNDLINNDFRVIYVMRKDLEKHD